LPAVGPRPLGAFERGGRRPHVLWISDSPTTPSGFGNVTRFVCAGLAQRGYDVHILGWQTREPEEWNGCHVHATGRDALGADAVYAYLLRRRPDVVVALADVWWLPWLASPHVRRQRELTRTPWVLYFPIDGDTDDERLPPSWVELLREVDVPVAMSRYGQEIAQRCGIDCDSIPHGVDLDTFAPPEDRDAAKRRLGLEGRFVVLSDSRNQPRKLLPRLLDVFAGFAATRPDAVLALHTDPDDEFARSPTYAYDVRADVEHLGLTGRVRFTPGFSMSSGLPLSRLAELYQAADVHLLASTGEGFGLPTLQAAAAGAVPLAGAYSASLELVEGHGEAIAIEAWAHTQFGIRRALLDVDDAIARLARLYDDREQLQERSRRSREFALAYGWESIVERWDALLRAARPREGGSGTVVERSLPAAGGASVTVRMVEHEVGRLEMAIASDAVGRELRIPAVHALSVPPGEEAAFEQLRAIFPSLERREGALELRGVEETRALLTDPARLARREAVPA
jgi:glycosyltransferase involved in cell wall biosynthesis